MYFNSSRYPAFSQFFAYCWKGTQTHILYPYANFLLNTDQDMPVLYSGNRSRSYSLI
jgi:hypothetical protein